jgi:hypothetical protein
VDELDRGDEPVAAPAEQGAVGRALANATEIGLAYGWAAMRAGVRAGIGVGRATTDVVGSLVNSSPIGTVAAEAADALEPTADRLRRDRDRQVAEAGQAIEQVVTQVVDRVVQAIDIDGIVQGIDIDAIVQTVDIDAIVKTIDVNDIVERIDINEIVDEIDIDEIVSTTEIGSLIVQSTGGVATEAVDVVRSQGVSLDGVVTRITDRLVRRGDRPRPAAPKRLAAAAADPEEDDGSSSVAEPS